MEALSSKLLSTPSSVEVLDTKSLLIGLFLRVSLIRSSVFLSFLPMIPCPPQAQHSHSSIHYEEADMPAYDTGKEAVSGKSARLKTVITRQQM